MQVVQLSQWFFLKLKRTKCLYKYAARRILRLQNRLRSERMAHALMDNCGRDFWSTIRRINSKPTSVPPSVDGTTGNKRIADHWASLFESVFNIGTKNARDTLSSHQLQATSLSDLRDSNHPGCDSWLHCTLKTREIWWCRTQFRSCH